MSRRIAAAPISWGVSEVPGWGHQLTPERVLAEMRGLGITATEFGPEGFLPADPAERADLLAVYGLSGLGGFVPVVLHDPANDPLPGVDRALNGFRAESEDSAGKALVLAAATGLHGYDAKPELDAAAWRTLLSNLDRIESHARERGIKASLHPHVGTVVEGREEVDRILTGSRVPLCLDTGHVLIGGTDPVALGRQAADRITHVHLKDVDGRLARSVQKGETAYTAAVREGIYRPLGTGDIDIAGLVAALDAVGYGGWYVLEQDTILTGEPAPGAGPAGDVASSLAFLERMDGK